MWILCAMLAMTGNKWLISFLLFFPLMNNNDIRNNSVIIAIEYVCRAELWTQLSKMFVELFVVIP